MPDSSVANAPWNEGYDSETRHRRSDRCLRDDIACCPMAVRSALLRLTARMKSHGAAPEVIAVAEIALAEALNNIVEHAYCGRSGETISLKADLQPGCIAFRLEDGGAPLPGLSPPRSRGHDLTVALQDLPEGGSGWLLIQKLTRGLNYSRHGCRNVLTFRVDFDQTP